MFNKRRIVYAAGAKLLALVCIASAQNTPVPAKEQAGFSTIQQSDLREDLAYLASDKLLGRMSLEPSDNEAAEWIARQFMQAGLKPLSNASGLNGYMQPFELIEYKADRAESSITLTRAAKRTVWQAPQALGSFKHAVDLTAPVVFAGYGITAPELGYDDYRGIDAKGKIVFVFDHEPQEDDPKSIFNGTGNTRYATARVKLLNAQAHGAVALLMVAEPNRKHLTNAERAARIGGSTARVTPIPLQAIADDEVKIPGALVLDAVAAELFATSGTTGSALQSAIDNDLTSQSRALPDTTLTLHFSNVSERRGMTNNVAGLLPGSDPKLAAETVIISGHHDHDGWTPCLPGLGGIDENGKPIAAGPDCKEIWHGADDNGSGTVGVVELAKAFAANPVKPKRSVLFVVFASEERGLLGSYWMAAHPLRPLQTTRAMINFDMIGRDEKPSPQTDGLIEIPKDTSNRLNLIGALYSPDYNKTVVEANKSVGLVLDDRFDHESALNVFFRSDQFPFVLHDVPAFWWFTGFHPDYHHITDTVEKIDYVKMQKILQLAYLSSWRFADDEKTPVFISNPIPAGTHAQFTPDTEAKVAAIAEKVLHDTGVPSASVGIAQNGKVVYARAFGLANVKPPKPATASMAYPIGSISKQFTATAALLLQQEGKLSLDDKVAKYFPELTRANEVSLRNLMTMTSGYEDFAPQDYIIPAWRKPGDPLATVHEWAEKPLDFDPGTAWQYSNTNYVLLGLIVQRVADEPLYEFIRERVLAPLHLEGVFNTFMQSEKLEVTGYVSNAMAPPRVLQLKAPGWSFGAGELAMPASTLLAWDIGIMHQSLLTPASYKEFETPFVLTSGDSSGYGLGVHIQMRNGHRELQHGGEVGGYVAENEVYPDDGVAIVVLTNEVASSAAGQIASALSDILLPPKANAAAAPDTLAPVLQGLLTQLQRGQIDRSLLTANCSSYFDADALADFQSTLAPLGTLTSVIRTRTVLRGGMTFGLYKAVFAGGSSVLVSTYRLPDGKIEQLLIVGKAGN